MVLIVHKTVKADPLNRYTSSISEILLPAEPSALPLRRMDLAKNQLAVHYR
jgi:hypothetical protein